MCAWKVAFALLSAALALGCSARPRATTEVQAPTPIALVPKAPEPQTFVLQEPYEGETLTLSPDARLAASFARGGRALRIWSVADQRILARLALPPNVYQQPFWASGGSVVALGGNTQLCAWDLTRVPGDVCFPTFKRPGVPALRKDAAFFATTVENVLKVHAFSTLKVVHEQELKLAMEVVDVGDAGGRVVLEAVGTTYLYTAASGRVEMYQPGTGALSHDERFLSIASGLEVVFFDLERGVEAGRVAGESVLWSPGAPRALVLEGAKISVWDASTKAMSLVSPFGRQPSWVSEGRVGFFDDAGAVVYDLERRTRVVLLPSSLPAVLTPSPDGSSVTIYNGGVHVVDVATGAERSSLESAIASATVAYRSPTEPVAIVVSAAVMPARATVHAMSTNPPTVLGEFPHEDPTRKSPFWWRSGLLLTWCSKGLVAWNPTTEAQTLFPSTSIGDDEGRVPSVSADGLSVAFYGGDHVTVADLSGKELARVAAARGVLSHDGALLATSSSPFTKVRVVEVATGRVLSTIGTKSVGHVHWSPRDAVVAVETYTSNGYEPPSLALWNVAEDKAIVRATGASVDWSPDGSLIAMERTGGVELHDASTFRLLRAWRTGGADRAQVTWSPDGKKLAIHYLGTASPWMNVARIYDVATGALLQELGQLNDLAWLADSETLMFVQNNRIARMKVGAAPAARDQVELSSSFFLRQLLGDGIAAVNDSLNASAFVRLSDGAQLWLRVAERDGKCSIFAHDEEGHFDGEPLGRVTFRVGDDLRTARVVATPEVLEPWRQRGAVASFLGGKR